MEIWDLQATKARRQDPRDRRWEEIGSVGGGRAKQCDVSDGDSTTRCELGIEQRGPDAGVSEKSIRVYNVSEVDKNYVWE